MFLDCSPIVLAVPVKTCIKCGEVKPATRDYFRDRNGRLLGCCLVCQTEYDKAYWQANRDKRLSQKKIHYEQNREEACARAKEWRDANPEKVKAANKAWYEANRDRAAEKNRAYREANHDRMYAQQKEYRAANQEQIQARYRVWREANKEYVAEYQKAYNAAHKEHIAELKKENGRRWRKANLERARANQRRSSHHRRARVANASGTYTEADLAAVRAAQTDSNGRLICWACGKPIRSNPHLDHWIPIAKGGANDAGNLHYMHAHCNVTKSAKHPTELGRLL